jgi:protocatechuate 4,5-dioxygenase alpha chain
MALDKPYLDVPGTTIFDAEQSRKGYHLNQFCMSLMKAANRERFKRCIAAGGNIYFLAKIGATDGKSFQYMAASMTGMTQDAYAAMMLAGGRSVEGNRRVGEQKLEQK